MVSRATATWVNVTAPLRQTATAECSSWVLPRNARSCTARRGSVRRLVEAPFAKRERLVAADHVGLSRHRRDRAGFFARERQCDLAGAAGH